MPKVKLTKEQEALLSEVERLAREIAITAKREDEAFKIYYFYKHKHSDLQGSLSNLLNNNKQVRNEYYKRLLIPRIEEAIKKGKS